MKDLTVKFSPPPFSFLVYEYTLWAPSVQQQDMGIVAAVHKHCNMKVFLELW